MLNDLSTSLTEIASADLDKLFEGTSEALPTADDLKFGKTSNSGLGDVPTLETIEEAPEEGTEEVKPEGAEPAEGEPAKVEPAKEGEEKKEDVTPSVNSEVLKSSVNFLVEKGIFKDFDGREELDVDDETFASLLEAQLEALVEERYEAKKSATGEYGQAIIDFIEKGGDADVIIDLFKEQQAVQQFDISSEDTQKQLISQYYKDVHEWSPKQIKRHLDTLATDSENALEEEASTIKGKYEQHYKKQVEVLKAEQEAYNQEQARLQQQYEKSLKTAIKEYEVDETSKKKIENALFKTKTLENGQKVNDFFLKFAELQQDPKKYVELVEFITDRDNFLKRVKIQESNKAVEKSFKFIKGGGSVSKTAGSTYAEGDANTKKTTGPDFASLLKRK